MELAESEGGENLFKFKFLEFFDKFLNSKIQIFEKLIDYYDTLIRAV